MTTPTCPHCPPEPIARELARKAGMSEYVVSDGTYHWRKRLDSLSWIAHPEDYAIEYWHGLLKLAQRERKLIESRY